MAKKLDTKSIFSRYLPEQSVDYCHALWVQHDFKFHIKQKRNSKLGDYKYDPQNKAHTITVNADLNIYSFLITYLHEVAHLVTQIKFKNITSPHGKEWKQTFTEIAQPMMTAEVFPAPLLSVLNKYFKSPKASSCSDPALMKALHAYDFNDSTTLLIDLKIGNTFELNGRIFSKMEPRRTRAVCKEVTTGKKYLISNIARVITKYEK